MMAGTSTSLPMTSPTRLNHLVEDLLYKFNASHVTVMCLDHVTLHLMSCEPVSAVSAVCIDRRCQNCPASRMPQECTLWSTVEPGLDWHKS